jgi:WD40 repeat protein
MALAFLGVTAVLAPAGEVPPERVDLYGDPLPERAIARLGTVRLRARCAWCLAFSRDGARLAAGSSDMTARLWDTATGREVMRFHGNRLGQVQQIALSPDGSTLATLADKVVRLWDARTGKHLRQAAEECDGGFSPGFVFTFSADGAALYVGPGGSVRAVTVADGKAAALPAAPERGLSIDAVSPDGTAAVSVAAGGRLVVWDLRSGKALGEVPDLPKRRMLALSGKRPAVAVGEDAPVVVVCDVVAGKELCRCQGHRATVSSLAFSPDGKALVSGAGDLTARLWDAESSKERWVFRAPGATFYWVAVAFGPDGKTVGAAGWDGIVRLLDAGTGKERVPVRGPLGWMGPLAVAPDGKTAFTASEDQSLRCWDIATGKELRVLTEPAVHVYDPKQRKVVHPDEWIYNLDVAPDGNALFVGHLRHVRVWDLRDPDRPRAGEPFDDWGRVALSPDGKTLATLGNKLRLLDARTRVVLYEAGSPEGHVLCFSPDGRTLAVGCPRGVVRLYHTRAWRERVVLPGDDPQIVNAMAFSPDGQLLAINASGYRVGVWEVTSGKLRRRIERKESMMDALAFSPDGRHLAIAGTDQAVCLHEVARGRMVHTFRGHEGWVSCLAFTPDGRRLISGSQDTTALVWDMTALPVPPVEEVKRTAEELEVLWERLAVDAEKADAAMRELAASPAQATDLLRRSLKPAAAQNAERIARLVRELDSDSFDERERASAGLEELGEDAAEALRAALERKPSPEVRRRAEDLLERQRRKGPSPERLRGLRAVQALEWIGTPEARRGLENVVSGDPDAELTRAAAAALARLKRR